MKINKVKLLKYTCGIKSNLLIFTVDINDGDLILTFSLSPLKKINFAKLFDIFVSTNIQKDLDINHKFNKSFTLLLDYRSAEGKLLDDIIYYEHKDFLKEFTESEIFKTIFFNFKFLVILVRNKEIDFRNIDIIEPSVQSNN